MSVIFDKLSFVRHLESDGTFARPQAEKLSEAFHMAIQESVATKADVAAVASEVARLEGKIDVLEAKVDSRFEAFEARVDARFAAVDAKFSSLESKMDASVASLKAWAAGVGVALFSALSAIRFFGH